MTNDIVAVIKSTDFSDQNALEKLAAGINRDSRRDPKAVASMLLSEDEEDFRKAAVILDEIGDLSFSPLLETLSKDDADDLVWKMEKLVSIQLANRNKLVKILDEMLDDRRALEESEIMAQVGEEPPTRRVCDHAYLLLRQLFALEEGEDDLLDNTAVFFDYSDEDRDAEIKRAAKSKKWLTLVDKSENETDEE